MSFRSLICHLLKIRNSMPAIDYENPLDFLAEGYETQQRLAAKFINAVFCNKYPEASFYLHALTEGFIIRALQPEMHRFKAAQIIDELYQEGITSPNKTHREYALDQQKRFLQELNEAEKNTKHSLTYIKKKWQHQINTYEISLITRNPDDLFDISSFEKSKSTNSDPYDSKSTLVYPLKFKHNIKYEIQVPQNYLSQLGQDVPEQKKQYIIQLTGRPLTFAQTTIPGSSIKVFSESKIDQYFLLNLNSKDKFTKPLNSLDFGAKKRHMWWLKEAVVKKYLSISKEIDLELIENVYELSGDPNNSLKHDCYCTNSTDSWFKESWQSTEGLAHLFTDQFVPLFRDLHNHYLNTI